MNKSDAEQFIDLKSFESITDAFENQLFPIKQFICAAPILKITFEAKKKRLIILQQAADPLEYNPEDETIEKSDFSFSGNLISDLAQYEQLLAAVHLQIMRTNSIKNLIAHIEELIEIHLGFTTPFQALNFTVTEPIILGSAMDRMEVFEGLKKLEAEGIRTIKELNEHHELLTTNLKKELLRWKLSSV